MAGPSKVRIGSPLAEFPGRSFNSLVTHWYRSQAQLGRPSKSSSGAGQILVMKARNVTGEDLNYGHCVAIEGVVQTVEDKPKQVYGRPLAKANKPSSDLKHAILGVALTSIANNKPGSFIYAGPAWLRCNYTSEEHNFATLQTSQSTYTEFAASGCSGHPILARELEETGEQWVLCLLGSVVSYIVAITETVEAADVGSGLEPVEFDAKILSRNSSGKLVISSETIKLVNVFPDAITVPAGKAIIGKVINGELFNASCTAVDEDDLMGDE